MLSITPREGLNGKLFDYRTLGIASQLICKKGIARKSCFHP
jgi:hypothetical protein